MNPDELQILFEKSMAQALKNQDIANLASCDIDRKIAENIPGISDEIASILYKSLRKNAKSMLKDRRRFVKGFEKRHYSLWKKGLDLLESFLVAAFELGENFNRYFRNTASENQDYIFEALTRLHARSIHVGFEVLCLLRSGYADGAHARWRTAHEISAVSNFLAMNKPGTAKRYLEHEAIESYRAMNQYQEYARQLNEKEFSQEDVTRLKILHDKFCEKYGEEFKTPYGWAAEALKKKKPTFADIEKASGLDHLRPYYKMASHNIHANPKGIKFRLGLFDGADILLAGPSNYGLFDPAHGVSNSVLQSTIPMLNLETNLDAIVMGKILMKFVDDIGLAFIETNHFMDEYNDAQQGQ